MSLDPTRRDAGQSSNTLVIHIEYTPERDYTDVETNIIDSVVFMRVMSNALRLKADEVMRMRVESANQRITMVPKVEM